MKEKFTFELINRINKIRCALRENTDLAPPNKEPDAQIYQLIRAGKEFEIWDTETTGLVLRIRPVGEMRYVWKYARGKKLDLGSASKIDHNQARALVGKKNSEYVLTEEDPQERKRKAKVKAMTYKEFLDNKYRPWLKANLLHGEYAYTTLVKSFPKFHALTLTEITPGVVEDWRMQQLVAGLKPTTVNRQLSDLRACLNRAKDIWELPTTPLGKVKACKIDRSPKVRYLTPGEEVRLREALDAREQEIKDGRDSGNKWRQERGYDLYQDLHGLTFVDHLKPAVLVSINTGLRLGELLKLRWESIDFEQRNLTVVGNTSKTGKTRHIPLNEEALNTLRNWKDQPGVKTIAGVVFGNTTTSAGKSAALQGMKTSWGNLLRRAKITKFRWHDLRHHFASKLVMAGVDLNTVRELLGHSDYKMTLRYAHLAPEVKQKAVDKLIPPKAANN